MNEIKKDEKQEDDDQLDEDLDTVIPKPVTGFLISVAGMSRFMKDFFVELVRPPFEHGELLKQGYILGLKTLFLVTLSSFIIGLVMTIQVQPTMQEFGAESWIPSMISISIIREIGPVLTALICAGKIGSGIGAELGSMKVTEQIDAMDVSGTNPFNYIVVTRVLATTLTIPILVFYADAVALFGSYLAVNFSGKVSPALFIAQAMSSISFADIVPATIKSFFFGFAIGIVGCYKGYNAQKGTTGVGNAANSSVVTASLFIFIIDLLAVQMKNLFY